MILVSVLFVILAGGIFYKANDKIFSKTDKNNFVFISYTELEKKIKNKENFVLVVTQEGCSHCKNFNPTVKKVANNYNIKIYDLNLTKLSDEESKKISTIANISGTPTTIFYKNGEEESTLNRINGETSEKNLINKLKKLGYIGD